MDRFGKAEEAYHLLNGDLTSYISSVSAPLTPTALSYSAWIMLDSFTVDYPKISHIMGIDGPGGSSILRLGNSDLDNNLLQMVISGKILNGASHLSPNAWYHVVGTVDSDSMKIYLDGNLEMSGTGASPNATGLFIIGNGFSGGGGDRGFHGFLDDIRVYNRVLSPAEIQGLYHQGGWPLP